MSLPELSSSQYHDMNIEIFRFFNTHFGKPEYDGALNFGAQLGEQNSIYLYMFIFLLIASINIYNNKHDLSTLKEIIISWLTAGVTLFLSLTIGYIFIMLVKNYTEMPRPFCSLDDIYMSKDITNNLNCKMSFPSGHVSFMTVIIASFWPLLNRILKTLFITLILFVAITRMASGAHYPIDLVGAVIIVLPLTLYIRYKVTDFVLHYEKKKSILERCLKKIFKLG